MSTHFEGGHHTWEGTHIVNLLQHFQLNCGPRSCRLGFGLLALCGKGEACPLYSVVGPTSALAHPAISSRTTSSTHGSKFGIEIDGCWAAFTQYGNCQPAVRAYCSKCCVHAHALPHLSLNI